MGCQVKAQCLRTADNGLIYGTNTPEITRSSAHVVSQFISGMLWDLRGKKVDATELDRTVLRGVELIQADSGFHDLILALAMADAELYAGKNCPAIYTEALNRGLGSKISDSFTCDDIPLSGFRSPNSSTLTQKSSKKSDDLLSCGTLSSDLSKSEKSPLSRTILLLLLLSPAMLLLQDFRRQKGV